MVERVHAEHVTAYGTAHFEEVDEFAEVVLVDFRDGDAEVRHLTIDVCEARALAGDLVDFVDGAVLQIVQIVEVFGILGDVDAVVDRIDGEDGLEHLARALLNVLTEGVQVGGEDGAGGEDALVLLAFALAEELLEPFDEVEELRLERGEQLHLQSALIKQVTDEGVLQNRVLLVFRVLGHELLHVAGALQQLEDVETGQCDGQQAHGGEHGIASAHIIGDHEGGIALLVGEGLQGAAGLVGDGHDALLGSLHAVFLLAVLFQDAESQGGFGGRARLGDHHHGVVAGVENVQQIVEVVLVDVVAGVEDVRVFALHVGGERVLQRLDDSAGAEVGAADADHHDHLRLFNQIGRNRFKVYDFLLRHIARKRDPAEEVVAATGLVQRGLERGLSVGLAGVRY